MACVTGLMVREAGRFCTNKVHFCAFLEDIEPNFPIKLNIIFKKQALFDNRNAQNGNLLVRVELLLLWSVRVL